MAMSRSPLPTSCPAPRPRPPTLEEKQGVGAEEVWHKVAHAAHNVRTQRVGHSRGAGLVGGMGGVHAQGGLQPLGRGEGMKVGGGRTICGAGRKRHEAQQPPRGAVAGGAVCCAGR